MDSDDSDMGSKDLEPKKSKGQLTLNQMLKALDKDVASGIEKRLKKLSKKKALKAPTEGPKEAQIQRIAAYNDVRKEVSKWEATVDKNRQAKHLRFPLEQEPDVLTSAADSLVDLKPRNKLEEEVQNVIQSSDSALRDNKELTKAEEKYLKAISAEEAKERHLELQRMRVLLGSYAAKMRRQKLIKSKSYRRLLKQERIKSHVKKVESDKDMLMSEIERLQRIRAQERASLKHKNTGKWAKHAKFRAKYDDNARKLMLEQIGIAEKRLERPAIPDSDTEDDDESVISEVSDESEAGEHHSDSEEKPSSATETPMNRLIVSSELINSRVLSKSKRPEKDDEMIDMDADDDDHELDDEEEDPQRQLMSEAFAGDDVVRQFKKEKAKLAQEEQPKDLDLFLPGWGDWAGPGLKINKKKKKRFQVKAKKLPRRDRNLSNVIISEKANDTIKELQVKKLPRGFKSDEQLERVLSKPTTATFTDQVSHRELTRPRVETKMGTRIEPINKRVLSSGSSMKWT